MTGSSTCRRQGWWHSAETLTTCCPRRGCAKRKRPRRRPRRVRYSPQALVARRRTLARKGQVYDRFAGGYDRNMRPLERWGLARLRARALAEVAPALAADDHQGRLLEVGAGTGGNFTFY